MRAEHLNDDRLGRVLDALYLGGLNQLFMSICMRAATHLVCNAEAAIWIQPPFRLREPMLPASEWEKLPPSPFISPMAIPVTIGLT